MSKVNRLFQNWKKQGAQLEYNLKSLNKAWPGLLRWPLERIAKLADPVTKAAAIDPQCFSELRVLSAKPVPSAGINATSAGNAAYLAIVCPDKEVRRLSVQALATMMKQQRIFNH